MVKLAGGVFKKKRNGSNASKTQPDEASEDFIKGDDTASVSSNKSGRSGMFKKLSSKKKKGIKTDSSSDDIYDDEFGDIAPQKRGTESGNLSDDSLEHDNARWSVMPDSRISGSGPKKKTTAAFFRPSSLDEDEELYMSDDDGKNLQTEEDENNEEPKKAVVKKKKKKKVVGENVTEGKVKKKKKKTANPDDGTDASVGSKKKKKKKKKSAVDEVNEKVRKHSEGQKSLKDRIRASLAIIGDKGGLLSSDDLEKLNLDSPSNANEPSQAMAAITEDDEDEEEEDEGKEEPEDKGDDAMPSLTPPISPLPPSKSPVPSASPLGESLSPVQLFRAAGKRMQDMQRLRQYAADKNKADKKFSIVFQSNSRESLNKGLISQSDKETVDSLLADLQEYERQLEEERNQIAEERDMMQLQQEAVEHLLETETMKTQELESRILELEEILENEAHRQETEELLVKIEMLETEIERQKETINSLASNQQDGLKRTLSKSPWSSNREGSVRGGATSADEEDSSGEVEEQDSFGVSGRDSVVSISTIVDAKIQGELLKLRSSVGHKDRTIEEQAKELARLREQLNNSEEVQKMHNLERTCEDFRNESKQFRSEVDKLKKQLTEMEELRKKDLAKMEEMKQTELENNEALKKLEVQNIMSVSSSNLSQSQLMDVLDINGGALKSISVLPGLEEEQEEEAEKAPTIEQKSANKEESKKEQEKSGWFGLGGDNGGDKNAKAGGDVSKQESSNAKEKDEGFNWFGFGKKKGEEDIADGVVAEFPSIQAPTANSGPQKQTRLSNVLDF